jgi:hypothetical protein
MDTQFNLAEKFDIGAYLYHRQLSIIPGGFSETVNSFSIVTTVTCTPFDRTVDERLKLTFWTFKTLNLAGGYDVWLSCMSEEKLSGKAVGYFSEPTFSTRINFKT